MCIRDRKYVAFPLHAAVKGRAALDGWPQVVIEHWMPSLPFMPFSSWHFNYFCSSFYWWGCESLIQKGVKVWSLAVMPNSGIREAALPKHTDLSNTQSGSNLALVGWHPFFIYLFPALFTALGFCLISNSCSDVAEVAPGLQQPFKPQRSSSG